MSKEALMSDPEKTVANEDWALGDVFPDEEELEAMESTDADPAIYGEGE